MKKIIVSLLAVVGLSAFADVNVNSVLGEAAMWLDASDPSVFTFDDRGGVATWRNKGNRATYGDAENYKVRNLSSYDTTNRVVSGSVESIFGAPGLEMGVTGSECDYKYNRITTVRTVFFVGRLDLAPNNTQKLAPLLGDTKSCHFHRGDYSNSYFWNRAWADDGDGRNIMMTFYKNSATTTCNGESTAPTATARDIIIVEAAANVESDRLSCDRNTYQRTGGRGINELLIFTRVLSAEERTAIYNYLDAKWNNGGWDTGAYEKLAAQGGPVKATFAADTVLGSTGDPAQRLITSEYEVAQGATATFNMPVAGGGLTFTGGGKLDFAGGGVFGGKLVQNGGTINFGGGSFAIRASSWNNDQGGIPQLAGNITWENGTIYTDYWTEFRPQAGSSITLAKGAGIRKSTYWRTFIDKGMTLTLAADAGVTEVPGSFIVTCDFQTDNYLNIHGGTLVVTNASESGEHACDITIGSQQKAGRAFMTMDGGRILTRRLRVASGWGTDTQGVTSSGTVTIGGGTVELKDRFVFGVNSGTRALATVNFNGGTAISPNGVLMYNDDIDVITFNGTLFQANADCAKYLDLRRNNGANVTLGAGGFPIEVASGKTVTLGWGLKGAGGVSKRGAGTLVFDQAATFTGGVEVQAGTAVAKTVNSFSTGALSVASGATAEMFTDMPVTLAADCAGALVVVVAEGGKQRVAAVENGFALANVTPSAKDATGNPIASAVFSVEDGALYVTSNGDLAAAVSTLANGAWYTLPWMRGDDAVNYPATAGEVMKATITATGVNRVAMNADAYAGTVAVAGSGSGAQLVIAGDHQLKANVDVTAGTAEFGVSAANAVAGAVTLPANAYFILNAEANEEWNYANPTFAISPASYKFRKTGAGRVTYPGLPDRAVVSDAGSFAMNVATDASSGGLNLTGAGLKEKYGTGTLTITGGTFGGPFAVTEGQLTINGNIRGFSSLYVGEGAKAYIPHCSQVNDRLPSNGQVVVDGGEIHVCGVNPFSSYVPEFWITNGMLRVDCSTGAEHIKFKNVHLKDSTFRLQGTANAYANNGIYYWSNSGKFYIDGDCVFEAAAGIPNAIEAEAPVPVVVSAGSSVVWGTPFMRDISKTGPGSVRFADTVDQVKCTATFLMKEGTLITGSKVPRLNISAGTTIKPDGIAPLTVTTTLTLPGEGTIAVDLSAIDFATREAPVRILVSSGFNAAMAAKFAFPTLPAGWEVTSVGGLAIAKITQPKHLYWNTQSGEWGEHLWNQDPNGYGAEGYHDVTFQDNTNGVATALTTVNVSGDRAVTSFNFNSTNTPYAFTGTGSIMMPTFNAGIVGAGYDLGVPVVLTDGGVTFATTTTDQTISDIRGPVGAVNVPAAAGGKATLGFTDGSTSQPGAVTIGSGKTLEFRINSAASTVSVIPSGALTGDATTKFVLTKPGVSGRHMDITQNAPNFQGKVEVANGGFLHVNAQFDKITATEQNPVWVHGAGSTLSIIGSQVNNRFTSDGWALIEDGGQFYYRGVNPCGQGNSPSLIVSNGTVNVEMVSGSHLHLKNLRFYGNSELFLTGTAAAWNNQGLLFFGDVTVKNGTTKIYRTAGTTSKFRPVLNGNDAVKNFTVEAGALLQLGGDWMTAPVKTGEGTVELLEGYVFPNNAFTVNGGYIKGNAQAAGLTTLTMANGTGFDLSDLEDFFQMASDDKLVASGTLKLMTGTRELTKGQYLMKWTEGHAPNCRFQLVSTAPDRGRFQVEMVADGVKVATKCFAILIR